jgi:hypothetical protein
VSQKLISMRSTAEMIKVLQEEMVKAYAMLGTLAALVELQPCQDEPAAGIWGDQTSA